MAKSSYWVKHEELIFEGKDGLGNSQFSAHHTLISEDEQVKVSGLSQGTWLDIAKKIDPALQWKAMATSSDTSFEGYFSYKVYASTNWKLNNAGIKIHKPCGHVIVAIVSGAMNYAKLHGLQPVIWAAKLKFQSGTPTAHYKTLQTKINGEYTCKCITDAVYPPTFDGLSLAKPEPTDQDLLVMPAPGTQKAPGLQSLIDAMPHSKPGPMPEPEPTTWALEYEPVKADALLDGETDEIPTVKRRVEVATAGLYVMEEIFAGVMAGPAYLRNGQWRNTEDLRRIEFIRRFRKAHKEYGERLARNFFDFLTIASMGEARYRDGSLYKLGLAGGKAQGRSEAYAKALQYDPRHLLPVLEQVFGRVNWGGGYGGPKWSFIAKQAQWYFKLASAPVAFADHVVDLAHNGGLAFNKGYIIANPKDKHEYMAMLTCKRNGYLTRDWKGKLEVPELVYRLMVEAVSLGFLQAPAANVWPTEDVDVPTLKWGSKTLKAAFKVAPEPMKQYMEKMEQEQAESKPGYVSLKHKLSHLAGGNGTKPAQLLEAR